MHKNSFYYSRTISFDFIFHFHSFGLLDFVLVEQYRPLLLKIYTTPGKGELIGLVATFVVCSGIVSLTALFKLVDTKVGVLGISISFDNSTL
jgi:hypothetical protein